MQQAPFENLNTLLENKPFTQKLSTYDANKDPNRTFLSVCIDAIKKAKANAKDSVEQEAQVRALEVYAKTLIDRRKKSETNNLCEKVIYRLPAFGPKSFHGQRMIKKPLQDVTNVVKPVPAKVIPTKVIKSAPPQPMKPKINPDLLKMPEIDLSNISLSPTKKKWPQGNTKKKPPFSLFPAFKPL